MSVKKLLLIGLVAGIVSACDKVETDAAIDKSKTVSNTIKEKVTSVTEDAARIVSDTTNAVVDKTKDIIDETKATVSELAEKNNQSAIDAEKERLAADTKYKSDGAVDSVNKKIEDLKSSF